MKKEKILLTPKMAEKIQDDIYYNMSAEKKVRITSQFFVLGRELNRHSTAQVNGTRRTTH